MLKRIPKSDISIRPFKAYKEWSFDETSTELTLLEANATSSLSSSYYPKNSIYGQLKSQFYNGLEDNPFLRFGDKTNVYETSIGGKDRFLSGSAKVISIPQIYVGEGIKKGSVSLMDSGKTYVDASGNLIDSAGDYINIVFVNLEDNQISFTDNIDTSYVASFQTAVGDFDIESGIFNLIYNGTSYDMNIISFDIQSGVMVIENIPFIDDVYVKLKIGNIFYTQGLIVVTRNVNDLLLTDWDLSFKSTKTIYEHEYLLIANEDEFNVSQNPSAVVEVGKLTEFITGSDNKIYKVTTNPGVKYIKKKSILETGEILDYRIPSQYTSSISGGFEHYDLSGSVDSTGSFLTPFITTIGLYDDNCDLVAVAKLPQPIKSEPDIPVNFIVRFDT
jgi:hypothetical protein